MHRVFVYGTLKSGFGNYWHFLQHSKFIGKAVTGPKYKMIAGGFPVLLEDGEPKFHVAGEVFEVDDATLKRLDGLEGEGSMYDRKVIDVRIHGQLRTSLASIYIGNPRCWSNRSHTPYQKTWDGFNEHGQLDWQQKR